MFVAKGIYESPTDRDISGLIIAYSISMSLLIVSELLQRCWNVSSSITRKIIHIGAGLCVLCVIGLFDHWQYAVIPHTSFIVVNAIIRRWRILKSMEPPNPKSWGTVYFCVSITSLFILICASTYNNGLKWTLPQYIFLTGVIAMTLGDAFAAVIGERYGRRRHYSAIDSDVPPEGKTYEGSAACFVAIFVGVLFVGYICSVNAWADALISAVVGTFFEAVSPWGTDNLTVPFSVCSAIYALRM